MMEPSGDDDPATPTRLPTQLQEREARESSSPFGSERKRGRMTCSECHNRKLRCDVVETGDEDCTNCKEHNSSCRPGTKKIARVCSLRDEKKRGRPRKAESPPMKASPLHIMNAASVHFGSPTQMTPYVSGTAPSRSSGRARSMSSKSSEPSRRCVLSL